MILCNPFVQEEYLNRPGLESMEASLGYPEVG